VDHSTLWRLFYSNSIFDLQLDGDIATIGITAHAADALGDIVFVDLPAEGAEFDKGDSFGAVESVKAASDVYAPVGGEVLEVNSTLDDTPGVVNESPIEEGWFMKVRLSAAGKADFEGMMDESAYTEHCENE
jgi:glycine cleavage system H protein